MGWTQQKPRESPWKEEPPTAALGALTCKAEVKVLGASNTLETRGGSPPGGLLEAGLQAGTQGSPLQGDLFLW